MFESWGNYPLVSMRVSSIVGQVTDSHGLLSVVELMNVYTYK